MAVDGYYTGIPNRPIFGSTVQTGFTGVAKTRKPITTLCFTLGTSGITYMHLLEYWITNVYLLECSIGERYKHAGFQGAGWNDGKSRLSTCRYTIPTLRKFRPILTKVENSPF